jgi:hypothetical protein
MKTFYVIFIIFLLVVADGYSQHFTPITDKDVRARTVAPHPRLLMTDQRLAELKKQAQADTVLQRYVRQVVASADEAIARPPLRRVIPDGKRLLATSRDCLKRIFTLGTAWRWTNDPKYAEAARENMLNVCGFMDWNPSHFLDVAEMTTAVSIGYDWLYSWLDTKSRDSIRNGLVPGLASYAGAPFGWWKNVTHNWNQVCNAGMIVGALAIADTDAAYAHTVIPAAVNYLPRAIDEYAPDGVWAEGPGYWNYATDYTVYGLACLQTALGTDFGLSAIAGFSQAAYFPIYCTGPTGLYLNYADSGEKSKRSPNPIFFWLGTRFGNRQFTDSEHGMLRARKASALDVVWYQPPSQQQERFDLDKYFRSNNALAVFRSAWNDPDALYAGIKAGYNEVNHGHLDLGNFELDALGVRWARDLGSDNYNMPGYFDHRQGGRRFTYYRNISSSHSVPLINGQQQTVAGTAKMVKTGINTAEPFAIVDLTEAYKQDAAKLWRGLRMVGGRKAVLIRDEYTLTGKSAITWAMVTDADIRLKGSTAELTLDGKRMMAAICEPAGAVFAVESSEQASPEQKNEGVKRLLVKLDGVSGNQTVSVLLSPVWKKGTVKKYSSKALAEW